MARIYKTDELKRVVFLGTPEFAVNSLEKLINSKFKPVLVITQPDKPKGRKQKLQPTPVKISSLEHGVPVLQPRRSARAPWRKTGRPCRIWDQDR